MIELSGYQVVAKDWLLKHNYGILGDEPGVGKTFPAIEAGKELRGRKLVVCPAYLIPNWYVALARCDETDVVAVQGSAQDKKELLLLEATWFIMSYETFSRTDYNRLISYHYWDAVIFDEAHRLKGRKSVRTSVAYHFRHNALRIWMLTGTPIMSNGGDIFPLLHMCNPKLFSSYWSFVETNCKLVKTPWATEVRGPRDKSGFEELLKPYMLRRKLGEVLPEIPDLVEEIVYTELTEALRKRYKLAKEEYKATYGEGTEEYRLQAAGLLSSLRDLTVDAKLEPLKGLLEDIPNNEQVVVFTWYKAAHRAVMEKLGDDAAGFTGEVSPLERVGIIGRFQKGDFRILVANLAVMTEGVDLQNARHVVFAEEDWVGAVNDQASARLRRRGQHDTVIKHVIITRRTIDERVHRVQERRVQMSLSKIIDEELRSE